MVDQRFPSKRILRSAVQWQALIQAWQRSGLSKNAFCQDHRLSGSAFGKWEKKLRAERLGGLKEESHSQKGMKEAQAVSVSGFIPVEVRGEQGLRGSSKQLDLVLVSGHRLSFQGDWPSDELVILLGPLLQTL